MQLRRAELKTGRILGSGCDHGAGLVAAAEAAVDAWRDTREDVAQPSLFGADPAEPAGPGELEAAPGRRGPGRPPGARNRSTEEWARYLLTRYRSPLIGLAELAQAHPHRLAAELTVPGEGGQVTPAEALRLSLQAAQALAPYLHAKQPTALEGGGAGMLVVQIGDLGADPTAGAITIRPLEENERKQDVSEIDAEKSE